MKTRTIFIGFIVIIIIAAVGYLIYSATKVPTNHTSLVCSSDSILIKCTDGSNKCVQTCKNGKPRCGKNPCTAVCLKPNETCVDGTPCTNEKTCGTGCCGSTQMCSTSNECVDCDITKGKIICPGSRTCCDNTTPVCCGSGCCSKDDHCATSIDKDGEKRYQCCGSDTIFVDGECCDLNKIYTVGGVKHCCGGKVCLINGATSCCEDTDAVCSISSQCVLHPNPSSPGPSPGNYVCAYTEPGPSPSTKYVDIPGGCKIDDPLIDPNSKCLGLGSLSSITCHRVQEKDGSLIYIPAPCSAPSTVSDGTQCSVMCSGKYKPSPGPQPPPLLCPPKDGGGGDTCATLTLNGGKTIPYCLNDSDASIHSIPANNPPSIQHGTDILATCSQYYEVDPLLIKKNPCLLYNVDKNSVKPLVSKNVVYPVKHMDNKFYCPVSFTVPKSSEQDEQVYSIVPLGLDEGTGSGTAPVQLTTLGYNGYGGAGEKGYMSDTFTGEVTYGEYPAPRPGFLFGPNEHGMRDGADIKMPVLMSTGTTQFNKSPAPKPRLVDCLSVFDEKGLNNINLDEKTRICTAHFDCSQSLGTTETEKQTLYGLLENAQMIPSGATESEWTGGYCANGTSASPSYPDIYGASDAILSNFARCKINPAVDVKEVPGVY